ncbi:MAG: diaminopimelate decarboxylase [Bacteroidia bacterium]
MFSPQLIEKLSRLPTPFYYYDMNLLEKTLEKVRQAASRYGFYVHYALKANANPKILRRIQAAGLGADCVSGNEIEVALENGFRPNQIVFAGVGKTDNEILLALRKGILCFNCESAQEIEVIHQLAEKYDYQAPIALRVNPNVHTYTHHYITTGLEENKFGISPWELEALLNKIRLYPRIRLMGLHFHIGSQITDLQPFKSLCLKVNELQKWFVQREIPLPYLNLGGGLGINYHEPDQEALPDFDAYFRVFHDFLDSMPQQKVHFELGRSIVAQCGTLFTRALYVKKSGKTHFVIVDAGMTELLRPALYQAYHRIENLSSNAPPKKYDVVGPICESSDCFGKAVPLPETRRGDLIAIRSVGAYGEVMALNYNLRTKAQAIYSDELSLP